MSITAGAATVVVAPVGAMLVGAFGRVEMYRDGRPINQPGRTVFLRVRTSQADPTPIWAIQIPAPPAQPQIHFRTPVRAHRPQGQQDQLKPLDKALFEERLERLLLG
jgi:hypothetical protein